jgi:hypothetical protein
VAPHNPRLELLDSTQHSDSSKLVDHDESCSLKGGAGGIPPVDPRPSPSGILPICEVPHRLSRPFPWEVVGCSSEKLDGYFQDVYPRVGGYDLPHHGVSNEGCGEFVSMMCHNVEEHPQKAVYLEVRRWSCGRLECPVCYERVAWRMARKAERRLKQFKHRRFRRVVHFEASVPLADYGRSVEWLRKRANELVKRCGGLGGLQVVHLWRRKCRACGHHPISYRLKRCSKCGGTRFDWYYSPHFHYVGFGWFDGSRVKENFERTGWVVKNEGVRKTVAGTIQYLLTHCAIKKGKHSLTWFGCCSYAKLRIIPEEKDGVKCPYCGEKLVEVVAWDAVFHGLDPPSDPGRYLLIGESWVEVSPDGEVAY